MSSSQVVDSASVERAQIIAHEAKNAEFQEFAVNDALKKDAAVLEAKDGEIDMTDAVAQAGRPLARSVIEYRLKQLNPSLRFERSKADPTKLGIYGPQGFILGMEWEPSPEFTVNFHQIDPNGKKTLVHQVRGWRVILDRLIRAKIIESERTMKLFQVVQGRESANWNRLHNQRVVL